ncbi:class I SAM-dependent methyltransferase [uncultured Clostridium sp.]|uniref:class I SAM-dependent methyltransferase n=1 Tax=uncultured Clostridium sp. TaxID=59620 RepID=UPI0025F06D9F|nr:class I SAM-dependent methyltransferase [uncultured Clostridium sp.]
MNRAIKYNKMVKERKDDELGLFEKYEEILHDVRKYILESNPYTIIDIGCGTGNLCGPISDKINVIGIDKNEEMLEYVKNKYKNMNVRLGSFLDEPIDKNYADIVVTTFAFHGLNDNEKKIAIKNMMDYLKSKGKIIIVDFMFKDEGEREKYKNKFKSENRLELWEAINRKYYSNVEKLESYLNNLNVKVKSNHIINFTWIMEIYL